jgi:hypothetical protein
MKHAINFLLHNIQCASKIVGQTSRVSSSYQNKGVSSYEHILDRFSKNSLMSNLMKICPVEPSCSVQTGGQMDRRRDMTKLTVAFRNFVKAPKIMQSSFLYISAVDRSLQKAT